MTVHAILLINAPDRKGLTALITHAIFRAGGNIIDLQQHVEPQDKQFFLRVAWELDGFQYPRDRVHDWLGAELPGDMTWRIHYSDENPGLALFVSREPHCLFDIIGRVESREWQCRIPLIISNHHLLEPVAERHRIPYKYFPIDKQNKEKQQQAMIEEMKNHQIDLIILARYMQILTPAMIHAYENRIINIHHSFLPAFPGSKPYHSAHRRGVKIIGATSHYVTEELDAGPIIAQNVTPVSHLDSVQDLVRKGRDIEKLVLARAITLHLQHKILVWQNRTVVFY